MPQKVINKRYKIELFDEKMCTPCENLDDRPNDICKTCPGFKAAYNLAQDKGTHWSVPQGDALAVRRLLKRKGIDFVFKDKRKPIPFDNPIKFTGKLFGEGHIDSNGIKRVNQKALMRQWLKYGEGMLKAARRSGKTVLACFASCRLKQKTVILADRFELLNQFYKTYMGDEVKGRPAMTNIPQIQEKTGREIIRIAQKAKDLNNVEHLDIILVNYQKFVRDPSKLVKLIENNFSFLVVDEAHGSGAEGYLRVVAGADVYSRMPLSATPRRKDNRHRLIERIMGPVVAESDTSSLIPEIQIFQSQVNPPRQYQSWTHAINWLSSNKDLRVEMIKQIFKDLRAGHKKIIVPLDRKKHIDALVKMVNHQAKRNNKKRGENWPEDLAIKFYNGVNRQEVLDQVDDEHPRVLFGMRLMIRQGIDFAFPSMIYIYIPMSASTDRKTGAPVFEQLSNRVCTPASKPQPIVRLFAHNVGMFNSCVVGLFWNEIAPKRYNGKKGKYRFDKSCFDQIKKLQASRGKGKKGPTQISFDKV